LAHQPTAWKPGAVVRWVNPGDWLAIQINSSDQLARLMRRKDDDSVSTLKPQAPP